VPLGGEGAHLRGVSGRRRALGFEVVAEAVDALRAEADDAPPSLPSGPECGMEYRECKRRCNNGGEHHNRCVMLEYRECSVHPIGGRPARGG